MNEPKRPTRDEDRTILNRNFDPRTPGIIPPTGIFSEPAYCFEPMNALWLPHFLGVIAALDQYDAWIGDNEEISNARNQVRLWLAQIVICIEETMYLLRQSESDPCILEQSTDGGESWTEAFNYALCLGIAAKGTEATILQIMISLRDIYNTQGDEGLSEWMTQSSAKATREATVCYAMGIWARMVFSAAKKRAEGTLRRDLLIKGALEVGAVLLAWFTGGISALVAAYAAAAVAAFDASQIAAISAEEWDDEATIQTVVCCVADEFVDPAGTNFDWEVVKSYIDSCVASYGVGTLERRMAQALSDSFDNIESWLAFTQLCVEIFPVMWTDLFNCQCECTIAESTRIDWSETGATPAGWTSTTGPATWHSEVAHCISTRSSGTDWLPTDGEPQDWAVTSIVFTPAAPFTVHSLGIILGFTTTNTHGYLASVLVNGEWINVGGFGDQVPAPTELVKTVYFDPVCCDAVRFSGYGRTPKFKVCSINQDA